MKIVIDEPLLTIVIDITIEENECIAIIMIVNGTPLSKIEITTVDIDDFSRGHPDP